VRGDLLGGSGYPTERPAGTPLLVTDRDDVECPADAIERELLAPAAVRRREVGVT
jgi:hypothetical protein